MTSQTKRNLWPWIITVLVLLFIVLCFTGALVLAKTEPPSVGAPVSTPTAAPARKPVPQKTNRPDSIGQGMWLVGEDVKPGKYRTAGAEGGVMMLCYWHTAKTDGDEAIIDQGMVNDVDEPGRVTLKAGQYFKTNGCKPWIKQ